MPVMRPSILAVALSVFVCAFAAADTITSVSPRTFNLGGGEDFLTITGEGLQGSVSTVVVFSGLVGRFVQEPSNVQPSQIITWVPSEVLLNAGTYSVTVEATDTTGVRTIGTGELEVIAPPVQQPPLINAPEGITVAATSSAGAQVFFVVTGVSYVDPAPTIVCTRQSGAIFPLGSTRVVCTAFDSFGSTSAEFYVVVQDLHAPVLHLPANITTSNPVVTYSVTAEDDLGGEVVISCSPLSGSTFPNGTTTVNCSAIDDSANEAHGSFKVTITGGAPALTLPPSMTVEATGPTGAAVTFIATSDSGPVTCNPPSGSVFPLGVTTVTCSATNNIGTASGTFNVNVVDTKPPVLTLPANMTAAAGVVTYNAFGTDLVDGIVPAVCMPPSGSTFAIGVTLVSCSTADSRGSTTYGTFTVTVSAAPPLTITVPANITAEATGPAGRVVTYTATANNGATPTCSPASGSTFPIATTTVNCTATDSFGQNASASFTVTIRDTTPPALTLPANMTVEATSPAGAVVTYVATATDLVSGAVVPVCSPASGTTFALGTRTVNCTATDARGNSASGSFTVKVQDTTAPQIVTLTSSIPVIWPPNHQMEAITLTATTFDAVGPVVTTLISISSNQAPEGIGDGHTSEDWKITGPMTAELRAERVGNNDRTYTLTVQATDGAGNTSTKTVVVTVVNTKPK